MKHHQLSPGQLPERSSRRMALEGMGCWVKASQPPWGGTDFSIWSTLDFITQWSHICLHMMIPDLNSVGRSGFNNIAKYNKVYLSLFLLWRLAWAWQRAHSAAVLTSHLMWPRAEYRDLSQSQGGSSIEAPPGPLPLCTGRRGGWTKTDQSLNMHVHVI